MHPQLQLLVLKQVGGGASVTSHSLEMRPSIWVPMQAVLLAVRLEQLEGLSRTFELHNDDCKEVNQIHAEQTQEE